MRLEIKKVGNKFEVHEPSAHGMAPIGRGNTMYAALGMWLLNNQREVGIDMISLDESAKPTHRRLVARELSKR